MPILRIRAFGLTREDHEELERLLKHFDGVEHLETLNSKDDIAPGVMYATAFHMTYLITFAGLVGGGVVAGAAKKFGEDLYAEAKERLLKRVADWKTNKEIDIDIPKRIHLITDDNGDRSTRRRF